MKNFRVKCAVSKRDWWKQNKIYDVINGVITDEEGNTYSEKFNIDIINEYFSSSFELVEDGIIEPTPLNDFFGVEDDVEFEIEGFCGKYKICERKLLYWNMIDEIWKKSDMKLNDISNRRVRLHEEPKPTKGEDLLDVYIPEGTRFRVINVEPHKEEPTPLEDDKPNVCLDEYVGKIARFNSKSTFSKYGFLASGTFEKEYMNAIDEENGKLCWRYDEVEILWEDED